MPNKEIQKVQDDSNEANLSTEGMFKEEDYWSYIVGVMLIAGLFIVPFILGFIEGIDKMGKPLIVFFSLVYSALFCYAHTKSGVFSFKRFFYGLFLMAFLAAQIVINTPSADLHKVLNLIIPGLLPIAAMFLSGWIGILIGRGLGLNVLKESHRIQESQFGDKQEEGNIQSERSELLSKKDSTEIYSFLHSSYLKWKAGIFDNLGDHYREQTENADLEEIANNLLDTKGYQELLEYCFNLRTPEKDEFFIGMHPPGFMVTSKFLYIYENKKFAKMHIIDLCDIKAFEYKATTFTTSCNLILRNEDKLLIKLSEYPDDEIIRKLQEMNGCEYLLEETPTLTS